METTNRFLSSFVATRARLAMLAATFVAATIGAAAPAAAQTPITLDLYAVAGGPVSLPMPQGGSQSVAVWGYSFTNAAVAKPGGPKIIVDQGAVVTITLHNTLAETTALLIQGQDMVPDTTGVASGATKAYTFTASRPGTYLYEAGLLPSAQHQVAMGLYGALVVRPTGAPLQAYADAATAFDDEAVLVLSEIDPALNADPAGFDMRDFKPTHFLINGDVYPNTAPIASAPSRKVLLRYVNGGAKHHSMATLGVRQMVVGEDGSALAHARTVVAKTIAPGQTADAILTVPAAAQPGNRFAVYDGNLMLHNGGADNAFGGMLTFVSVPGSPTGDTTGPVSSGLAYAAGTLTATVSDATTGNGNVTAAQYRLDSNPALAMTGSFGTPTVSVSALVTVPPGAHTLYVRGQDAAGNWGAFATLAVNGGDITGPTTSALVLAPNPSNGAASVALSATASDVASGGSNIASAQYTIDGGAPVAMTRATAAPVSSITATIPAGTILALSEGSHVVSVTSTDAAGNTGAAATINLIVDKTGPATSNVSAAPNPNNGTLAINQGTQAVRVTATLTDARSNVVAAEGYFCVTADPCTAGAPGTGFPLLPSDGVFNSGTENVYADIPLASIAALTNGNHTIHVRGRDAAGNWAATTGSVILVIDKVAPTVSGMTLTPAAVNNAAVVIGATASDVATGNSNITAAEYFVDTVGAAGAGTAMTVAVAAPTSALSATISATTVAALTEGNHTVYVRARDAAGNWSTTASAVLTIDRTAPTISGATLTPATLAFGAASTTLSVTANGTGTSVIGSQYWIDGTTTPPGNATAFTGNSVAINTSALAGGTHQVRVRVQDAALNWSAVTSVTLYVVRAVADTKTFAATGVGGTQTQNYNTNGTSLLANDFPSFNPSGTAALVSAPQRTSGAGAGVMSLTCTSGTPAPVVGGSAVCTNGRFTVNLTGVGGTAAARAASRRGTFTFTYSDTYNGATSTATVTITVN